MSTWMYARLERATRDQDVTADAARRSFAESWVTRASYSSFLTRIYGFEMPIEAAFARTPDLGDLVDLRARTHVRLLRADLAALGVANTSALEVCRAVVPFRTCGEALGWMYVIDRNARHHGVARRHLVQTLPDQAAHATSYFSGGGRAVGPRLDDLSAALDRVAQTPELADQIVEAALAAFAEQHTWFHEEGRRQAAA